MPASCTKMKLSRTAFKWYKICVNTVCPKTPNIPVFLRQAGNTILMVHKDDITKTIFFLMRFIKMTVVKSDFFWISKADHLLS